VVSPLFFSPFVFIPDASVGAPTEASESYHSYQFVLCPAEALLDPRIFTCPSVAFGEGGAEWVAKGDIGIVFCNLLFGASCLFNVNP